MLGLVALGYQYDESLDAKFAWHFGWYAYHKAHAARMRRVIQSGPIANEQIAVACRKAAAENLRKFRDLIRGLNCGHEQWLRANTLSISPL